VVLSSTALLSFMSVRKAAALALAQLGVAAFFVSGVTTAALGPSAGWFVLAAVVLAAFVRAIDIESWAVFIRRLCRPGRPCVRARLCRAAAAAVLTERLVLAALAVVIIGHYVSVVAVTAIGGWRLTGLLRARGPGDSARRRVDRCAMDSRPHRPRPAARHDRTRRLAWHRHPRADGRLGPDQRRHDATPVAALLVSPVPATTLRWYADIGVTCLVGLCLGLPSIGGGEVLAQAAHELQPPRVLALWRTALVTLVFAVMVTALTTFLFVLLVPAGEQSAWVSAPLAGLAQHLAAPGWLRGLLAIALVGAAC
jgi:hypothetical protein